AIVEAAGRAARPQRQEAGEQPALAAARATAGEAALDRLVQEAIVVRHGIGLALADRAKYLDVRARARWAPCPRPNRDLPEFGAHGGRSRTYPTSAGRGSAGRPLACGER